jgi:tetratricopeptide (TPR) repeat protein
MRPERRFVEGLSEELPALRAALCPDSSPREVMPVAEGLWLAGRSAEAIALLEPLVRESPGAIAPRVLLAWCHDDVGRPDRAALCREQVRELDPANPWAGRPGSAEEGRRAAAAAERAAEPEGALTEQELREIPPSPLYSATLAEIFARQGFEEKAIEIYRALEEGGGDAAELRERIRALEQRAGGAPA